MQPSVQRLRSALLPKTYDQAAAYLRQRRETIQFVAIFQRYFPEQFCAEWEDQNTLFPSEEQVYSGMELRCLELIDSKLFPFNIDYVLMNAEEGERHATFPLYSFGIDIWDRPFSDFDTGWQILLLLIEPLEGVGEEELAPDVVKVLAQAKHTATISLESMRSSKEPLCFLPDAFRMIQHSTGNVFLDPTDEMPCEDMEMNLDDVALLVEDWPAAEGIMQRANTLAAWLAAAPSNVKKVVELWNNSQMAMS